MKTSKDKDKWFISKDTIPLPHDYNVKLNFQFLQRSPKELLHRIEGNTVKKLFLIGDEKIVVSIIPNNNHFNITFYPNPDEATKAYILAYINEWFDLTSDLSPFYALAIKDKLMKPLVIRFSGYRIVGQPDLFESLVWAVIGQQINLPFAYTLKQRFVENYGEKLIVDDVIHYTFPKPEVVANLNDADLLPLQFSRQKSKYVKLIAEAFLTGAVSKAHLIGLSLDDAKDRLMKIKGVGNWTANYALMKTFRYSNAFPLEDAGIHNAIKYLKKLNRKPTLDEVKRFFKKYKGWEAYATLYLWKSLELIPRKGVDLTRNDG